MADRAAFEALITKLEEGKAKRDAALRTKAGAVERAWKAEVAKARAEAFEEAARAVCNYAGRCNSNKCPCHRVRALAGSAKVQPATADEEQRALWAFAQGLKHLRITRIDIEQSVESLSPEERAAFEHRLSVPAQPRPDVAKALIILDRFERSVDDWVHVTNSACDRSIDCDEAESAAECMEHGDDNQDGGYDACPPCECGKGWAQKAAKAIRAALKGGGQ
jgi:hypothetical protein